MNSLIGLNKEWFCQLFQFCIENGGGLVEILEPEKQELVNAFADLFDKEYPIDREYWIGEHSASI